MERLQAAIEKARAQREARGEVQGAPKVGPATAEAPVAGGPWDSIEIPKWNARHLQKHRVVSGDSGPQSSPYDMLRTKVMQMMRQNDWKRLAITSPDKSAGKSTTCCNLLASFSRQADRRSILIDLDMRRPAVASILGHKGQYSFADVLEETVSFGEQAVRFRENAAVSMNYRAQRNPTELLLRDRTAQIIDEIERVYQPDIMIFDMPPMMLTDDTQAFLKNVDCAILVAGAESTTIDQIDVCEKDVAGLTNVLGVVLNKCEHMGDAYGYDYY